MGRWYFINIYAKDIFDDDIDLETNGALINPKSMMKFYGFEFEES